MELTKTLTSALAAAGLVGAIGLAYAQTSGSTSTNSGPTTTQTPDSSAQPVSPSTSTQVPPATGAATDSGSTSPAPGTTDSGTMQGSPSSGSTALEPQADRN